VQARYLRKHRSGHRLQDRLLVLVGLACSSRPYPLVSAPPTGVGFRTTSLRRAYRNYVQVADEPHQVFRTTSRRRAYRNSSSDSTFTSALDGSEPPHAEGRIETRYGERLGPQGVEFRSTSRRRAYRNLEGQWLCSPLHNPVPKHLTPKGVYRNRVVRLFHEIASSEAPHAEEPFSFSREVGLPARVRPTGRRSIGVQMPALSCLWLSRRPAVALHVPGDRVGQVGLRVDDARDAQLPCGAVARSTSVGSRGPHRHSV